MIDIHEKKGLFTIRRVWFETTHYSGCTLLRLMRQNNPVDDRFAINELSYTVINGLNKSEDEILMGFRKTVRNEIRRAQNDSLELEYYIGPDLSKSIIDEFEEAYLAFAKKLENDIVLNAYNRVKIEQYKRSNCLLISKAIRESLVVYHVYVYDENEACLIYSVSDFRDDSIDNNLAGRANKFLHHNDLLTFKKLGLSIYDWGNISNPDTPNGIDNFKLSFGGEIRKKYNSTIGCNLIGKLYVCHIKHREVN